MAVETGQAMAGPDEGRCMGSATGVDEQFGFSSVGAVLPDPFLRGVDPDTVRLPTVPRVRSPEDDDAHHRAYWRAHIWAVLTGTVVPTWTLTAPSPSGMDIRQWRRTPNDWPSVPVRPTRSARSTRWHAMRPSRNWGRPVRPSKRPWPRCVPTRSSILTWRGRLRRTCHLPTCPTPVS